MEIREEINQRVADIEQIITGFLPGEEGLQKTIMDAMLYSVTAGGKRLRPLLMQETSNLFGAPCKALPYFMAAIEFIHTYSLVHDDLPAMDNDEYRRGKKTTHVVYGEAMGVLAGDALLNYAFEVAATSVENETVEAAKAVTDGTENAQTAGTEAVRAAKALGILSRKAGIYGMIGGQVIDVGTEGQENTLTTITTIHRLKTCAMIESAMMIGAVLGGATDEEIEVVEKAAYELGMAFQIQDDVLDVIGDEEKIGKPVGSDEKNHKVTYVTIEGVEASEHAVLEHTNRAISMIESLGKEDTFLKDLMKYLIHRES